MQSIYSQKKMTMKKTLFLIVFLLIGVSQLMHAQDKKNAVKLSLLAPFIKTLNLGYERILSEKASFQVHGYYTGYSDKSGDPTAKMKGFGIIPEVRLYLSEKKTAPGGFFVAPFIRYDNFSVTDSYDDGSEISGSYSDFGGGLLIGHQSVFSNIVTLDAYIGPQYIFGSADTGIDTPRLNGVLPRGGVTIGLLF